MSANFSVSMRPSTITFPGASMCRAGAPGASAAFASTSGAVSSISTMTASAQSSAASRLSATTAATGSPAKRTTSPARIGWAIGAYLNLCSIGTMGRNDAMSAAVSTVPPPGVSTRTMRPAATGLRTNRTHLAAARSPVKRPCPVTSAGSSTRRSERPTQPAGAPWEVTALPHFTGGFAANFEPRTHLRPRGSCHNLSVACRWPSA